LEAYPISFRDHLFECRVPWDGKIENDEEESICHQCKSRGYEKKAKCPTCSNAYCGYCLQKFYCENVLEILGDVDQYKSLKTRKEKQLLEVWSCPSCRNICLCKFCRTNNGFSPIDESTFDTHDRPSIAHYLIETFARSSYSEDEFHEDSKRCRNHNQDLISNKFKDENAMFSLKNKTEVEKGDFIACRAPPEHGLYFYLGCVKKKSWKKKCFSSLDGTRSICGT